MFAADSSCEAASPGSQRRSPVPRLEKHEPSSWSPCRNVSIEVAWPCSTYVMRALSTMRFICSQGIAVEEVWRSANHMVANHIIADLPSRHRRLCTSSWLGAQGWVLQKAWHGDMARNGNQWRDCILKCFEQDLQSYSIQNAKKKRKTWVGTNKCKKARYLSAVTDIWICFSLSLVDFRNPNVCLQTDTYSSGEFATVSQCNFYYLILIFPRIIF